MEQTASSIDAATPGQVVHPYAPSWVDRFTDWLDRRSGPAWLYYLTTMTVLIVAYLLVLWWRGFFPAVSPVTGILLVVSTTIYLSATHYLDHAACDAMERFRPSLEAPASRVAELEYCLTTMPARTVWIVTLLGAGGGSVIVAMMLSGTAVYPGLFYSESIAAGFLEGTMWILVCITFGIFAYHTIHQMRAVSAIYAELTRVDVFNQEPLHAFARLAAYTAVIMMLVQYLWFTIGLTGIALAFAFAFLAVAVVLAVSLFFWPLYGIHRLLVAKKAQLQRDAGHRLEKSLQMYAEAFNQGDMPAMGNIGAAMKNAEHERQLVTSIPTWPWPPGLVRGTLTAVLLPLFIWGATRLLERFFGS